MTDKHLDTDLMPDVIRDRADIEQPIRDALADAPDHASVDLPGMRLDLDYCCYPDGTPIWDKPLNGKAGGVRATRADGEVIELTIDGQSWDTLTTDLLTFMDGWSAEVGSLLTELRITASRRKRIEEELQRVKAEERRQVVAAVHAGATRYRAAKVSGLSKMTVGRWMA